MEIRLHVSGYPPAKGEAVSMFGVRHPHGPRVRRLLEAAHDLILEERFSGFGSAAIGLEMVLRCSRDRRRGDATNYLGGVGDVLEAKSHRQGIEHLGDLARVALYDNDRLIEEIRYRWERAVDPSYSLRIWELSGAQG